MHKSIQAMFVYIAYAILYFQFQLHTLMVVVVAAKNTQFLRYENSCGQKLRLRSLVEFLYIYINVWAY